MTRQIVFARHSQVQQHVNQYKSDLDETPHCDRLPSRRTMPGVSLFEALEHERRGRAKLFPSALDGCALPIELAIVGA